MDVGARGGLKSNWAAAKRHLRIFGFEPDKQEFERLTASAGASGATEYFGVALHNRTGTIRLNVARDRGLSSLFDPTARFSIRFPTRAASISSTGGKLLPTRWTTCSHHARSAMSIF